MTSKDDLVRDAIAEQASEWFVANDEAPLNAEDAALMVDWLKTSPVHVEEFLSVAGIARDLRLAGSDPEPSTETPLGRSSMWRLAVAALALITVAFMLWTLRPAAPVPTLAEKTQTFATRHGEQRTFRLRDGSVVHLNTDSAVTVRYSPTERVVVLTSGEADFKVTHESQRAFRVLGGPAVVVDLGTQFNVRLQPDSAVVTVIEGRVAVEPASQPGKGNAPPVQLRANEQLSVVKGQWPAVPIAVDALRTTAWLHRQIVFDHEPLGRVAAEFNRYAATPVEITAPELRDLEVSGVFSTDDPEEFVAFLRSLEGVRVEVTPTRIRVSQK